MLTDLNEANKVIHPDKVEIKLPQSMTMVFISGLDKHYYCTKVHYMAYRNQLEQSYMSQ